MQPNTDRPLAGPSARPAAGLPAGPSHGPSDGLSGGSSDGPSGVPGPDAAFWQAKFDAGSTPWDRGAANPQIEAWVGSGLPAPVQGNEGGRERPTRVLVPGCGSGHEVAMLAERAFDVTGVDFAAAAVERTRERLRGLLRSGAGDRMLKAEVVQADLLTYEPAARFDAIYEQTCLCALYPDHWQRYAGKLFDWLRPGGLLLALFMQAPREGSRAGYIEGPPYHCDINAMRALFSADRWQWPKPAYPAVPHPAGIFELAVVLTRR